MKKKFFSTIAVALFFATVTFAQVEVKVNPIGLLFGGVSVSGEYLLSDNMGVELTGRLASRNITLAESVKFTGFGSTAAFKYYFSPDVGGDNFYAGVYLRYVGMTGEYIGTITQVEEKATRTKVALGFNAGYKWVAESGLLFEIGTGLGRNLISEWTYSDGDDSFSLNLPLDFTFRVSVGWRF